MTHRRPWIALVAMLALAGGLPAGSSSSSRERKQERAREAAEEKERRRADAARQAADRRAADAARADRAALIARERQALSQPSEDPGDLFGPALDLVADADALAQRGEQDAATPKYQAAAAQLEEVVAAEPGNHEAWNQLGYARRSAGAYEPALEAYAEALRLEPGYGPALEYQAEAHLALGRLPEVREAYVRLFRDPATRPLAGDLLHAMRFYVQVLEGHEDPGEGFADFAASVRNREALAGQSGAEAGGDW